MKSLVLASTNPGKIRDYRALFAPFGLELRPQADFGIPEIEETGLTFIENALLKARHAALHTRLPTLADDSGLVVDALGGAPGLYSARYAGHGASAEQNMAKLLSEIKQIPNASRKARLYSVLVLLRYPDDPAPLIAEGSCEGEILELPDPHPHPDAFGYLPVFYLPKQGCTAAALSSQERATLGHRTQATQSILTRYLAQDWDV